MSTSSRRGERETTRRANPARRRLLIAAAVIPLALGVVLLVERALGYRPVLERLQTARPIFLAVAVVAETVSFVGFIVTFRAVAAAERGPWLSTRTATRLVLASLGAARALAAGGPAGIAVLYWGIRQTGADKPHAGRRVFALYALVFGIFAAAGWLAAAALVVQARALVLPAFTLPWLVAVPALFASAAALRSPRPKRSLRSRHVRWLRRALMSAQAGLALAWAIARRPRRNAAAFGGGCVYWLGDAACLWAALRAFDIATPLPRLALAYATAYLVTLLPLPLGGIGSAEAAATLSLNAVGVPVAAGLLAVLAYRAVNFWLPTLPGLAAFATLRQLRAPLRRAAAVAADTDTRRP